VSATAGGRRLFLLFNHRFTQEQGAQAREQLGITDILPLPGELQRRWGQIPPELPGLQDYLAPLTDWLARQAQPGDYVLIQGDFGATYLMVRFALEYGLIPVYATTRREAHEMVQPDGSVRLTHTFRHQQFRRYGV
jgi:hypothetical protein